MDFQKKSSRNDFGIDAYFDIITERYKLTGKSIAVQIKSGDSYFKNLMNWAGPFEVK